MRKIINVLLFIIFIYNYSFSQNDFVMWNKLSPEIRLNIEEKPFEFRWRPVDYFLSRDIKYGRTDIMLGVNLWKFKIFSYSKFDERERMWTGARLDFNHSFLDKKLLIHIQERYYFGLNEKSLDQFYIVDFIMYRIFKRIYLGALCYGQWNVKQPIKAGLLMIGPVINIILPYNFNILITSGNEMFHKGRHLTIFRLGYKILIKKKKKKEPWKWVDNNTKKTNSYFDRNFKLNS